jgi:riboflavin-specific deaminase-like protein
MIQTTLQASKLDNAGSLIEDWLTDAAVRSRRLGRPVVTLSYAQSLDGCLTIQRGRPTALSGSEAMRLTHELRAAHQAILVGIGTVLADNPRLDVRLAPGDSPRPVILDTALRTPVQSKLMQRSSNLPWIVTNGRETARQKEDFIQRGARLIECQARDGQLNLTCLLGSLLEMGVERLMVEGGARVITSFLDARLVDQVMVTVSPVWLGGLPALERMDAGALEPAEARIQAPAIRGPIYEQRGQDMIIWGRMGEKWI